MVETARVEPTARRSAWKPVRKRRAAQRANLTPEQYRAQLVARVEALEEAQIKRARESCPAFIEYVMRNEADGSRVHNAEFHLEWQQMLDQHDHAVIVAPVEHAKSQQISVSRVLFELGLNPNLRIALISNTEKLAKKFLKQIRAEIERNERLHLVFPGLRRSSRSEDPWSSTAITVERSTIARDPSIQVLGAFGPIVGSRLDLIVMDDVLDFENTRTDDQRKKLSEWFDTTVYTRLVDGGRCWFIGTPWHPDDLLHELGRRPAFAMRRYSAVANPDDPPARWRPIWPGQWPLRRLLSRRRNMAESHFVRKYLCRVRLDATSRFKRRWLDIMVQLGKGRTFELAKPPRKTPRSPPLPCFTGVDLGVGETEQDAQTVIFTLALLPDGRRLIVNIEAGRWQAPEILERLEHTYQIYRSEILVENNGAQKYIVQLSKGRIPCRGYYTSGKRKFDEQWGVEALAVELRQMQWIMPSGASGEDVPDEGKALLSGLLHYDPLAHTSDHVMAMWLARECVRRWAGSNRGRVDTQRR